MKPVVTDIDIDSPDRNQILNLFPHVIASNHNNNNPRQHNTGVYFHDVPVDPLTNRCSIDYKEAEKLGYFKIDVLNVGIYNGIRDQAHMDKLLAQEPIWELLGEKDFCDLVFHMRGHHDLCKQMKPSNILELAAVLSIIRPSKRYLAGKPWSEVFNNVWVKAETGNYYFKKAHAVGYAMAVKLHMNILIEQLGI